MKKLIISAILVSLLFVSCKNSFMSRFFCSDEKKSSTAQVLDGSEFNGQFNSVKNEANKLDWLRYPSISPDGKQIAFSYMGDIYITPVAGGFARALTTSEYFESNPVWSHDSSKIAFVSNRFGNFDVFVMSVNGGESKRLTFNSAYETPMTFSNDDSKIYFNSVQMDNKENSSFPSRVLPELYSVPVEGGNSVLELSIPVFDMHISKDGKRFVYHDRKGYENYWRKHHKSSVTRDIWEYSVVEKKFTKISDFEGEDLSPVFSADDSSIYFLSEKSGSFNVWKNDSQGKKSQLTNFTVDPVRFLSASNDGTMCFSYRGQLYTFKEGGEPVKLDIYSANERVTSRMRTFLDQISEITVSPDGMEMVAVLRGEIYAFNPETGTTKRITDTPGEERWVSFHPDGRKILYSAFRNGSWNIYETSIEEKGEPYFFASTKLVEKPVIANEFNTYQPLYSPDGKMIAYLKERTELVVYNVEKDVHTTVLPGDRNISYVDGDQRFQWSPDGSKIAVIFNDRDLWSGEIGIVSSDGTGSVINITNTGTDDINPKWNSSGTVLSWINQGEIYAFFLNREAMDEFNLTKEEFDITKKLKDEAAAKIKDVKKDIQPKKEPEPVKIVKFENDKFDARTMKISLNPSNVQDYVFSPDNETLYFITNEPAEYKISAIALREKKDRIVASIPHARNMFYWDAPGFSMTLDKTGTNLFVMAEKKAYKIATADGKMKPAVPQAEFSVDGTLEKQYLFEHVWKTVNDKFYVGDMHNVDWKKYFDEYSRFIPYINNNYDFAEMVSEMLGELNASHTGSGYIYVDPFGDDTSRLGIFYTLIPEGVRIDEIIEGSPLQKASSKIVNGTVIEKIDGISVAGNNFDLLMNRKTGKNVRLALLDPKKEEKWEETVKPINIRAESDLLYKRWVETNRQRVDELSKGKLGYVHIRGMDMRSFMEVYNDIMGKYHDREGIVIDTRFNGGGWLHNELSILFSGKSYTRYSHRGQKNFGGDPANQWTKKSILLVSESNYSDAHLFPYAYKTLKLGKIVGMPVPGTSTAVWWPSMLDETLYFGIPQIGIRDIEDKYLENNQLAPDFVVPISPEQYIKGEDPQIEKAVSVILDEIK